MSPCELNVYLLLGLVFWLFTLHRETSRQDPEVNRSAYKAMSALQEALGENLPKNTWAKKVRLVANPIIEPSDIASCFVSWLAFCSVADLYETLVPPAGCPQTWSWRSRPQAQWLVSVAGLFYDLIKNVCKNTKLRKLHILRALDLMLKQGKLKVRDAKVAFEEYKDKVDLTVRILLQMYRKVKYQEATYKHIARKLSPTEKKKLDLVLNEIDFGPDVAHVPGTLPQEMEEEKHADSEENTPILVSPNKKAESVFDKVLKEHPIEFAAVKPIKDEQSKKKQSLEIVSLKSYDPRAFDWTTDDVVSMFATSSFEPNEVAGPPPKKKKVKVLKKPVGKKGVPKKKPASQKKKLLG